MRDRQASRAVTIEDIEQQPDPGGLLKWAFHEALISYERTNLGQPNVVIVTVLRDEGLQ